MLTAVIDAIVPFYIAAVLLFISYYNTCTKCSINEFKLPVRLGDNDRADGYDWKKIFNGTWITTEAHELDSWSDFCHHNFVARALNKTAMLALKHKINIKSGRIYLERNIGGSNYWTGENRIGVSEESAEPMDTICDGLPMTTRVWVSDEKKLLYFQYTPKENGYILRHTRCINEDGDLEVEWDGYDPKTNKRGAMLTIMSKVR